MVTVAENGIVTDCGNAKVELAVASESAFRVSVSFDGAPAVLETPMVDFDQSSLAKWTKVTDGEYTGIKTSFGSVLVTKAGALKLLCQ